MTISIKDVAKEASVSTTTVSFILGKKKQAEAIPEETKKRVLAACERLNYLPNIHARLLATRNALAIGLVTPPFPKTGFPNLFGEFMFSQMLRGIEEEVGLKEYKLLFQTATDDFIKKKIYIRLFREKSVDGLLLWGTYTDDEYVKELYNEKIPFILVSGYRADIAANYVRADNYQGALEICTHLVNLGYKQIGHIQGPENVITSIDRKAGYVEALRRAGLVLREDLIQKGNFTEESGYQGLRNFLKSRPFPEAIFCGNDYMAIGAMKAMEEEGLRVPEDIAVVGADDTNLASYVKPALTTFKFPTYEIGKLSVQKLFEFIESKAAFPIQETLPTEIVIRESCGATIRKKMK